MLHIMFHFRLSIEDVPIRQMPGAFYPDGRVNYNQSEQERFNPKNKRWAVPSLNFAL